MAQIARDHPEPEPPFHPVLPMIGAFAPPIVPPQAGNAPLDARTPAVSSFEAPRLFQGLTFLGKLARGWDGHPLDCGGFELVLRFCRMHAPIARYQTGRMRKESTVMRHRLDGLPMLVGVLQDLVARHDACNGYVRRVTHDERA